MNNSFGLLDTSVVIDLFEIPVRSLPNQSLVSALTLAELTSGISTANDSNLTIIRRNHVNHVEAACEIVPFDRSCAHAYSIVAQSVVSFGRKPRGKRAVDYLIATTAAHLDIPLYTRNPKDFEGLEGLVEIVAV
jgi:predicted nucleic acid-binding protein